MLFISSKKLFSFSRYSDFCNSNFPESNEQMKMEQLMISRIDFHKLGDVIFGITQKLFYITSSNLVR